MAAALFICYSSELGGAERVLLEAVRGWRREGERDAWLACPEGPLADHARTAGARVAVLRARSLELRARPRDRATAPLRLAGHRGELQSLIAALHPDLVLVNGMRSAIALTGVARRGTPLVLMHHDMLPSALIGAAVRRAGRHAALVLVPSRAVAADLDPDGDLGARLLVVHPGVDVEQFVDAGEPAAPPEVIVLGALAAWKRVDVALEAVALVRRRLPEVRLRIVGAPLGDAQGELLERRLRERASQPDLGGAVTFAGGVDDPRPELQRAALLLHCAAREPFGLAVVEALAAGRPVVAPAAGGPLEIVDPSCGVLYPPGDVAAAAAAIVSLLQDPARARAMGASGRSRARARFDVREARSAYAAALAPLPRADSAARRRGSARGVRSHANAPVLAPLPRANSAARRRGSARGVPSHANAPAIVTVTHNSADALESLLRSISHHLGSECRVIVVDNASRDVTRAVAERWRGELELEVLALSENIGFGAACNRGVARSNREVTALLNPDVELLDGSLLSLAAEALRTNIPARLLAPLVVSGDGRRESSVHVSPCSTAALVHAVIPPAALPARAAAAFAPWRSERARAVGWAAGCALVAPTDMLRALGPFDESIFLYAEDMDLCLRARRQGMQTWFRPEARVLHHGAHSSRAAFGGEPFERLAAARHDVMSRRLGARCAHLDDALQALTFLTRIALKRAARRDVARERSQLRAVRYAAQARGRRPAEP
ncbi:MAG: glycosyltransferase [Solirubrobacteraceae bacterium]